MKKCLLLLAIGFLLLAAGGYTVLCAATDEGHVLPKTTVHGTDISGLTRKEAVSRLKKEAASHPDASITISLGGTNYTASVNGILELDYEAAVKKALEKNGTGFWARGIAWIKAFLLGNDIADPPVNADTDSLYGALAANGFPDTDTYIKQPYKIQGEELVFSAGAVPEKIDKEMLTKKMIKAFQENTYKKPIPCPLAPSGTADLDVIYQEVHREPENATLDPEHNYAIIEGKEGLDFDMESARAALEEASKGKETSVKLLFPEPEVNAEKLAKHLFSDTLSSYTTKISGPPNCVSNIHLAAEKCAEIILPNGYEFSFNNAVGEQTAATGFKTADAILDGKIIQAYGGGICQVSTTIFDAALYANLDILEHWNHDYVSSYVAAGMDAAVAWGVLDMRIGNSLPYPVKIQVRCTGDDLTATVFGTKTDDSFVEIETEVLKNSPPHTMEVVTHRKVYTENRRHMFTEKAAYSSYIQ